MFDPFIDSFQDIKKSLIKNFVPDSGTREVLNEFVDAQTAYTKAAVEAGAQTAGKLALICYDVLIKACK